MFNEKIYAWCQLSAIFPTNLKFVLLLTLLKIHRACLLEYQTSRTHNKTLLLILLM